VKPVRARSLSRQVHEEIVQLIDSGAFPPGASVGISDLARRFEVSSTPVREALAGLAAEGRLLFHENIGYRLPALPSGREYADWAAARIAVESSALLFAFGPIDGALLDAADAINEEMRRTPWTGAGSSARRYSELNRRFHAAIVAVARNPLLDDLQQRLYTGRHFANVFIGRGMPAIEQVVAEHQRIVDALRLGDTGAAARELRVHIVQSLERDARVAAAAPALRRLLNGSGPGEPAAASRNTKRRGA
jgi:DNA-binding GntR family transcriptional regulator